MFNVISSGSYCNFVECDFSFIGQNESLNGGGVLFTNKHKDLRIRVVHGNTLTAAVILNELPKNVKEIFLTGATSKLGRAIALYLCQQGVRVLVSAQNCPPTPKCANKIGWMNKPTWSPIWHAMDNV